MEVKTPRLFGTDGIRGRANTWPITPEVIVQIGRAVAYYFQSEDSSYSPIEHTSDTGYHPYIQDPQSTHPCTVVIGKDTRLSGYMIESALVSGLVAQGAHVIMLGPVPTPAVAMLVRSLRADIGIMISASHNPYQDNGIKFFDRHGVKLATQTEKAIEKIVWDNPMPYAENCGKSMRLDDAAGRYIEFAKMTCPKGMRLKGLRLAVDCANGATYKVAPRILWELGASVHILGDHPNGRNINEHCGALYPEALVARVQAGDIDLGIALDGDGDRLLLVTPKGQCVNGDQILALLATYWKRAGILGKGIVSTGMSNSGLLRFLRQENIPWYEANVGDKHVLEEMQKHQCNLGGEESGHIILSDHMTTGDGLVAALQVLHILLETGQDADSLFPVFDPVPQKVFNFRLEKTITDAQVETLRGITKSLLHDADDRILIRRSGTEPVLRVMVQSNHSESFEKVQEAAKRFLELK